MKHIISMLLAFLLLCSCTLCGCESNQNFQEPIPTVIQTEDFETTASSEPAATSLPSETDPPAPETTELSADPIEQQLDRMSTEELVGQLFLANCPAYNTAERLQELQLGGYVLFGADFDGQTPAAVRDTIARYQAGASIPLLIAVDEEGGTVTRVSSQSVFRETPFPSPRSLYETGAAELVLKTEAEKSELLRSVGINVNLAPVCDICTDPSAFMYQRSLGLGPEETADMVCRMLETMSEHGISGVLKHFPGYGNNTDTHVAMANDYRTLEELEQRDLVPFQAGADAGCDAIMVSHTVIHALDPENPATLSPAVHQYLREWMGYEGVIITDDLGMQAITDSYGTGQAAVLAVLAGNDMLITWHYEAQYQAVLEAVENGTIPLSRIRQSAGRILRWKQRLMSIHQFT